MEFKVSSAFEPQGDQKKVISEISDGLKKDFRYQTIIGATGTGKTYVMAKIIEKAKRPALILAHNKTLAAQLFQEFKHFFPQSAVEYFVSYYDYYQPEAYVAKRDLFIEKDSAINEEIDRMRLKATTSLLSRKDVIIVSSVSCIYGLGSPENFKDMNIPIHVGQKIKRDDFLRDLVRILYERNDDVMKRGCFRVRGEVVDIIPSYMESGYRLEFFGDEIEMIHHWDIFNQKSLEKLENLVIFPAKHFVTPEEQLKEACRRIKEELEERVQYFDQKDKMLEKERIHSRTLYDLEMLRALGTCAGVENYSRHLTGRKKGEPPATLLNYFPKDFILFVDESHVTLPQVRGMFNGDLARKTSLVDHGFRLPSALDNRPLTYEEFSQISQQTVYVSATPNDYELEKSSNISELINRPTGLVDPIIKVRPTEGQIDDLLMEIKKNIKHNHRVIVTTLTKKMSENLSRFLQERQIRVTYLHSDIDTIERVEIIQKLRQGKIDVLVGINLLREGLDLPEVALVAIMDADKIGFLRSKTALIQTVGRAARNVNGYAIMYADRMSDAMKQTIDETNRRRKIQLAYNEKNNITPLSIKKLAQTMLERSSEKLDNKNGQKSKTSQPTTQQKLNARQINEQIKKLDIKMKMAADQMNFEEAISLREMIKSLKDSLKKKK